MGLVYVGWLELTDYGLACEGVGGFCDFAEELGADEFGYDCG